MVEPARTSGLPAAAKRARQILREIFVALGGLAEEQAAKRITPLPGDFRHAATGTLIEVDQSQHFTSYRLTSLALYPDDALVGFDVQEYQRLCREWAPRSDRYWAAKAAVGFGGGGRQRQRPYHETLRDLVAPEMGRPPVIRVPAADRNGEASYARVRDGLLAACHLA